MSDSYLSLLAKPYKMDGYLNLFITPHGQVCFETLKHYCMGSIFSNFSKPIYISSPVMQSNLTNSNESISLEAKASLRHTFHHFYFEHLRSASVNNSNYPLEYIEQGAIFRNEKTRNLKPFLRMSHFNVTNLHAFCINKEQSLEEIKRVFNTLRSFEKDWHLKFKVLCHVHSEELINISNLTKLWGDNFEIKKNSDEEAMIALDFYVEVDKQCYELCSLEICQADIGGKKNILVDFTVGGIERILATIYYTNLILPDWLAPITLVTTNKNVSNLASLPISSNVRIAFTRDQEELLAIKEKFKVPYIHDGKESLKEKIQDIETMMPIYLKRPLHNNLVFDQYIHNYEVLTVNS